MTTKEMTDEQRRAMFARLNGGSGGRGRNPYEITNPSFGEKAGAFLSGFASGAFEGLADIGSVLTFKPLRDKWEDDFWRNNEGRRIAEAEKRAAEAAKAAGRQPDKPHSPQNAELAADLYYNPPQLPERPEPVNLPKPQQTPIDLILDDIYSNDPGAEAMRTARSFRELAEQLQAERDELQGKTWERPEAPNTKRGSLQQARREAAAKPGATSASIIAAVEEAKAKNAQASQWKKELRKATKGAKTPKQLEKAMEEARRNFFADYNAALDAIGRQERARDMRVQSLEKAILKLDTEARKATERAETARQRQETAKERTRLRLEAQDQRAMQRWERDQQRAREKQEREYKKAVAAALRQEKHERREDLKTERKNTTSYVKATESGITALQEMVFPGAAHDQNRAFLQQAGHFQPKNWGDKRQRGTWHMALGAVNDLVREGRRQGTTKATAHDLEASLSAIDRAAAAWKALDWIPADEPATFQFGQLSYITPAAKPDPGLRGMGFTPITGSTTPTRQDIIDGWREAERRYHPKDESYWAFLEREAAKRQ